MAVVTYSCTKCKPVDTSVIEAYMVLVNTTKNASIAEASRASAEEDRAEAEAQRSVVFASDHSRAESDHESVQNAVAGANAAAAAANAAGITSAGATVDDNTGTPYVEVSLENKNLSLSFHNIKGEKGEKGDRGDGAVAVVNNLVTGGTDAALSAEMGKTLNNTKQATLVSGTNIKTINGEPILGSGDMQIQAGDTDAVKYVEQTLTDSQKTQARANIGAGTYSKAATGIPKTDLASEVQGSLDLADTAIQAQPVGSITPPADPSEWATAEEVSQLEAEVTDVFLSQEGGSDPLDLQAGFYKDDLTVNANPTFTRAKVDVSKFKKITVNASVRSGIYIHLTNANNTILWSTQSGKTRDIDLTAYNSPKWLYLSNETSQLATPSVIVEGSDDVINKIDQTYFERRTVGATHAGYINRSGGISGTSGTWKHTDLYPIDQFNGAEGMVGHSSVSNIAFFSANEITSGNFVGYIGVASGVTTITKEEFVAATPVTAKYFAACTDYANSNTLSLHLEIVELDKFTAQIEGLNAQILALETEQTKTPYPKTLHFSFDDTISAFYDIAHNNRASIFDNVFFGALKTLHETYGAVFSCYCFLDYIITKYVSKITTIATPDTTAVYYLSAQDESYAPGWYVYKNNAWTAFENVTRSDYVIYSLSSFPSTYVAEFSANSKWLKFGLHCKDGMVNYGEASGATATTDYNSFISSILSITGTPDCVDTVVRLQNFSGSLDACRAMRDCDLGVQGFLCSDYSETNGGSGGSSGGYYLANPLPAAVWKKGQIYDYAERLHFYVSGLRIDSTTSANMPAYMAKFLTAAKWEQTAMIEMYAHENQMFNASTGTLTSDYVARFEAVCDWMETNGVRFGYQMDKIRMAF